MTPLPGPLSSTTDGRAVAALVCAVAAWFLLPVVLAVVALLLARSAERAAAPDPLAGRAAGLVTAARWVAGTQLVLVGLALAFLLPFLLALRLGG